MNRSALAFAFALAVLGGCKKKDPAAVVASDAGVSDAAATEVADAPFAVVAEGPMHLSLSKTTDGRILIADGPMLYEAKADGAIVPVLGSAELATLIPDDDIVVGYSETHSIRRVVGSLAGSLVIDSYTTPSSFAHEWRNGKLVPLPRGADEEPIVPVTYRGHVLSWSYSRESFRWVDGATLPVPQVPGRVTIDGSELREQSDGSLVAIAHAPSPKVFVWKPDSETPREIPFPEQDTRRCHWEPMSFRDRVLLACADRIYAIQGDRFVTVLDHPSVEVTQLVSEDATGSVYVASNTTVLRCPPGGAMCRTRDVPTTPPVKAAHYEMWPTDFVKPDSAGEMWKMLAVIGSDGLLKSPEVRQIMARSQNDVWLLAYVEGRTQILHTTIAPPERPMLLPSMADARVALRNTRAPAMWTGPCEQVYVRLGSDADAIVKRVAEIKKAIGIKDVDTFQDVPHWAVVEGRIGDQRGVGVVLSRRDPEQKLAVLESAAHKLVDAFASGGANRPNAYCTLPVLERRLVPTQ